MVLSCEGGPLRQGRGKCVPLFRNKDYKAIMETKNKRVKSSYEAEFRPKI